MKPNDECLISRQASCAELRRSAGDGGVLEDAGEDGGEPDGLLGRGQAGGRPPGLTRQLGGRRS